MPPVQLFEREFQAGSHDSILYRTAQGAKNRVEMRKDFPTGSVIMDFGKLQTVTLEIPNEQLKELFDLGWTTRDIIKGIPRD
ncbi:hypothetical protein KBD71_00720 [Candidatus Woesebacteria bacterium]|nr:hypothetical protein [Candidatus Woesebacteria bacterium]